MQAKYPEGLVPDLSRVIKILIGFWGLMFFVLEGYPDHFRGLSLGLAAGTLNLLFIIYSLLGVLSRGPQKMQKRVMSGYLLRYVFLFSVLYTALRWENAAFAAAAGGLLMVKFMVIAVCITGREEKNSSQNDAR